MDGIVGNTFPRNAKWELFFLSNIMGKVSHLLHEVSQGQEHVLKRIDMKFK